MVRSACVPLTLGPWGKAHLEYRGRGILILADDFKVQITFVHNTFSDGEGKLHNTKEDDQLYYYIHLDVP